jgi:hypothetical protein
VNRPQAPASSDPRQLTLLPSAAATSQPVGNVRRLQLGGHVVEYTLLRSKRRTIGFLINDSG